MWDTFATVLYHLPLSTVNEGGNAEFGQQPPQFSEPAPQ
jgi:hypothetical protein